MPNNKPMEISMDTMSSSNPTSTRPQKVGTYIIEKTIGKGNFSFVKLGYHTLTKVKVILITIKILFIKVAIKIIDKTKLSEENIRKAQREAEILKTLHHPNIIKLYQVMESEKLLFIVTEYLPNGELYGKFYLCLLQFPFMFFVQIIIIYFLLIVHFVSASKCYH